MRWLFLCSYRDLAKLWLYWLYFTRAFCLFLIKPTRISKGRKGDYKAPFTRKCIHRAVRSVSLISLHWNCFCSCPLTTLPCHLSDGSVSKQPSSASDEPELKRADHDGTNYAWKIFKASLSVLCIRGRSKLDFFFNFITKSLSWKSLNFQTYFSITNTTNERCPQLKKHVCIGFQEKPIHQGLKPLENRMKLELLCFQKLCTFCCCGFVVVIILQESFQTTMFLKCQQQTVKRLEASKYLSVFCHRARHL